MDTTENTGVPVTPSPVRFWNKNKILIAVLATLLIVIIIIAGFLFLKKRSNSNQNNNDTNSQSTPTPTSTITDTPTPSPTTAQEKEISFSMEFRDEKTRVDLAFKVPLNIEHRKGTGLNQSGDVLFETNGDLSLSFTPEPDGVTGTLSDLNLIDSNNFERPLYRVKVQYSDDWFYSTYVVDKETCIQNTMYGPICGIPQVIDDKKGIFMTVICKTSDSEKVKICDNMVKSLRKTN